MKPSLLPYLRCPVTGERLDLFDAHTESGSDEVIEGQLVSASGRKYPIEEGVPVLIAPESFAEGQAETLDSFSAKWQLAPNYRDDTRAHYESWYLERYAYRDMAALELFLADKQLILDAGTGAGRDAQMYAQHSDALVVGLDLSKGIHVAYQGLHDIRNLHFVQADLQRPPFEPQSFDFIACDQVIHHTPDTRASLEALLRYLQPGGHIAFYVYKVKGPIREFSDSYIRERTTKMSPEECLQFSESITKLGQALSSLRVEVDVPEDIPLLKIEKGRIDIQRFIYWNVLKCYWNEDLDWTSNVITNFDWYHPLHAHRHTVEEVRLWCDQLKIDVVHLSEVESGISVLGRKH